MSWFHVKHEESGQQIHGEFELGLIETTAPETGVVLCLHGSAGEIAAVYRFLVDTMTSDEE